MLHLYCSLSFHCLMRSMPNRSNQQIISSRVMGVYLIDVENSTKNKTGSVA